MAKLVNIIIIHTTADEPDANTDAHFRLIASTPGVDFVQDFKDLKHDERERGRTDEYEFPDVEKNPTPVDSDNTKLVMVMTSSENGWLPKSIWAFGVTADGQTVVLGKHPTWNKWFDRGPNAVGKDRYVISN